MLFLNYGHDAYSCDLQPDLKKSPRHFQGDLFDFPQHFSEFDLLIAHPPCTYLSSSGLHWNKRVPGREALTQQAIEFVNALWHLPVKKICIENPVGCISTRLPNLPKPQYIQPYEFGHDASKKTGLWLKNLPELRPTFFICGRLICAKCKAISKFEFKGLRKNHAPGPKILDALIAALGKNPFHAGITKPIQAKINCRLPKIALI